MTTQMTFLKETAKTEFYRIGGYEIRISKTTKYAFRNNANECYADDSDQLMLPFITMVIVNKSSGKKSSHRCFQPYDELIMDLESDYSGNQTNFRWK